MIPPRLRLDEAETAIRPFVAADADALLEARMANRDLIAEFEPRRDASFFTRAGQAREIALDRDAWDRGQGFAFAVLDRLEEDRLIGRAALSNIVRGPWQNATLGYWIDERYSGRGHATAAVRLVVRFGFEHAALHRIQPAIMPRNARSRRVVEKVGFRLEGRALRYLSIAGTWEDHDIYALTAEDL
jgi:[ribosomal protein S5]-alanine N-acetyltransferase